MGSFSLSFRKPPLFFFFFPSKKPLLRSLFRCSSCCASFFVRTTTVYRCGKSTTQSSFPSPSNSSNVEISHPVPHLTFLSVYSLSVNIDLSVHPEPFAALAQSNRSALKSALASFQQSNQQLLTKQGAANKVDVNTAIQLLKKMQSQLASSWPTIIGSTHRKTRRLLCF